MQPLKWFHRGTAPMVAIYPDADGGGGLYAMSRAQGLRPVRWTHNGTGMGMAIYPGDTDGTIRALPEVTRNPGLAPVHWFHEGRYPITVNFNDEYPPAGGEEYEGPLDLAPNADWAVSFRRMSADFDGPVIRVKQTDAPENEQDFSPTLNNAVDPDAVQTFLDLGGGSGFGITFYDQSGNAHNGISGGSFWVENGGGGKPAFSANVQSFFNVSDVTHAAGARTYNFVVDYTESANGVTFIQSDVGTEDLYIGTFWNQANELYVSITDGASDVTYISPSLLTTGRHLIEVRIAANGVVTILVDGDNTSATVDSGTPFALAGGTGPLLIPAFGDDTSNYYEIAIWPGVVSAAQSNIATYYGITL